MALRVRTLDNEDNKSGATQIPLISDLIFDETLPLRSPRKTSTGGAKRKIADPRKIPPGYDPDTGDLFGEFADALTDCEEPDLVTAEFEDPSGIEALSEALREEIKGELEALLQSLK